MQDANEVKPARLRLVYPGVMAVSSDASLGQEWDSRGKDGAHSAAVVGERWRQDGERERCVGFKFLISGLNDWLE